MVDCFGFDRIIFGGDWPVASQATDYPRWVNTLDDARRILWMYTSRDVYRMLVHESGWSPDRYQEWLARTLLDALVAPATST